MLRFDLMKVKEREGPRLIARLFAWIIAWMMPSLRVTIL